MNQPQATAAAISLGTLAVTLTARIARFRENMDKAIRKVRTFNAEVRKQGARYAEISKGMAGSTKAVQTSIAAGAKSINANLATIGANQVQLVKQIQISGKAVRADLGRTAGTVDRVTKNAVTRGKQQLGAVLSFQAGVAKFFALNVRWFVIWRSFWFVWGGLQKAAADFNVLLHETSLALRTSTNNLSNEIEVMAKRAALTKEAIKFTAQHILGLKDYIKSFYYLTTAGLTWKEARQAISVTLKTAIALDEDAVKTTRTLTSLYNVFGETLVNCRTPLEKMQKISAILTATFREQDIEMADYNKAITYVGAVAKTSGVALEIMIASLGVMSTHFVKGSKSGTALARSMVMLLKHPERLAKITGVAFDPKKPLEYEKALRRIGVILRESAERAGTFGAEISVASKVIDLFGIRGMKVLPLAEHFEKLADQIAKNRVATFGLVEAMVLLVESDPSAQLKIFGNALLMNIVALVNGASQTQNFSFQLAFLNKILAKSTGFMHDFGATVGSALGSIEGMISAIAALGLATGKLNWGILMFARGLRDLPFYLLLLGKSIFHPAKAMGSFGATLKMFPALFIKSSAGILKFMAVLGKFFVWLGIITTALSALRIGHELFTKTFSERSKDFVAREVIQNKKWYQNLWSTLNYRNIAYRWWNAKQVAHWEILFKNKERHLKKLNLTEEEFEEAMMEYRIKVISRHLGITKEAAKIRFGLISAEEKEISGERVRIENELQKSIKKLTVSELEYQLYSLDQRRDLLIAKLEERTDITKEYNLKRAKIFKDALKKIDDDYKTTYDSMLKTTRTSLDNELLALELNIVKLEGLLAMRSLIVLRSRQDLSSEEQQLLSDTMKALADEEMTGQVAIDFVRQEAAKAGFSTLLLGLRNFGAKRLKLEEDSGRARLEIERKAEDKFNKIIEKNADFSHGKLIETGKKDLESLKGNYEKRGIAIEKAFEEILKSDKASSSLLIEAGQKMQTARTELDEQYESERTEIARIWADKRAKILEDTEGKRYRKVQDQWENEVDRLNKFYDRQLKIVQNGLEKIDESTTLSQEEMEAARERFAIRERELELQRNWALLVMRKKFASLYFLHRVEEAKKNIKSVAWSNGKILEIFDYLHNSILAGITETAEEYIKSVGGVAGSIKRITEELLRGLEEAFTEAFAGMLRVQEENKLESLELVKSQYQDERDALREQLEEGQISRKRYYLELDEIDRRFTEEMEERQTGFTTRMGKLWVSLRKVASAELAKLVISSIASMMKSWAVEKGLTMKSVFASIGKGIASIMSFFAKTPYLIPVGIALAAGFAATVIGMTKKFLAKGGITKGPSIAGEKGPEAVLPLERRSGRLVLSERGKEILAPLLAEEFQGLVHLNQATMAAFAQSKSGSAGKIIRPKTEVNVIFEGDTIDFAGSMPMIDDISTVDRVYEDVWLPAKRRRLERVKEIVDEVATELL